MTWLTAASKAAQKTITAGSRAELCPNSNVIAQFEVFSTATGGPSRSKEAAVRAPVRPKNLGKRSAPAANHAAKSLDAAVQLSCVNQTNNEQGSLDEATREVCAILLEAITAMRAGAPAVSAVPTSPVNTPLDTRILDLVAARGSATPRQMVEALQASRTQVQQSLTRLVTTRLLTGTGRTRGRTYHLPAMEAAAVA